MHGCSRETHPLPTCIATDEQLVPVAPEHPPQADQCRQTGKILPGLDALNIPRAYIHPFRQPFLSQFPPRPQRGNVIAEPLAMWTKCRFARGHALRASSKLLFSNTMQCFVPAAPQDDGARNVRCLTKNGKPRGGHLRQTVAVGFEVTVEGSRRAVYSATTCVSEGFGAVSDPGKHFPRRQPARCPKLRRRCPRPPGHKLRLAPQNHISHHENNCISYSSRRRCGNRCRLERDSPGASTGPAPRLCCCPRCRRTRAAVRAARSAAVIRHLLGCPQLASLSCSAVAMAAARPQHTRVLHRRRAVPR